MGAFRWAAARSDNATAAASEAATGHHVGTHIDAYQAAGLRLDQGHLVPGPAAGFQDVAVPKDVDGVGVNPILEEPGDRGVVGQQLPLFEPLAFEPASA